MSGGGIFFKIFIVFISRGRIWKKTAMTLTLRHSELESEPQIAVLTRDAESSSA